MRVVVGRRPALTAALTAALTGMPLVVRPETAHLGFVTLPRQPGIMLLRTLLASKADSSHADLSFRMRGAEVSRLEGFSDAVFGFAITLLVISSKTPGSSAELLAMRHAVIPFIASFTVLFALWRAQFDFFRRYGLEDRRTIRLTGALLVIVLLAVYPVRFLATFVLDVVPLAVLGGSDSIKAVMPMQDFFKVILLYAIGFTLVSLVLARLYAHAASQRVALALSDLELFDTRAIERRYMGMVLGGVLLMTFTTAMLLVSVHSASEPAALLMRTYALMLPLMIGVRLLRGRTQRRLAVERLALVGAESSGASHSP